MHAVFFYAALRAWMFRLRFATLNMTSGALGSFLSVILKISLVKYKKSRHKHADFLYIIR